MNGTGNPSQSRRKSIGFAVFLVALPLLLGGGAVATYVFVQTHESIETQAQTLFDRDTKLALERFEQLFAQPTRLLKTSVINAEMGVLPLGDREKLGNYLLEQLKLHPQLAWYSYSEESSGRFHGAMRHPRDGSLILNFSDPEHNNGRAEEIILKADGSREKTLRSESGYDPRKRDWYAQAKATQGPVFSKPYPFFEGPLGITLAQAYRKKGELKGVFTADLLLSDISQLLERLSADLGGHTILTSRAKNAFVLPTGISEEKVRPLVNAIDNAVGGLQKLPAGEFRSAKTEFEGEIWLVLCRIESTPDGMEWALVTAAPQTKFIDPGLTYVRYTMYALGFVFLLALAAAGSWAWRVVARLRETERMLDTVAHPAITETTTSPTEALTGEGMAVASDTQSLGKFELPAELHRPVEDLSGEVLLKPLPKLSLNGREFPSIGGIPLLAKLGQGGMGAVYFGYHPRLRKEVAVKILSYLSSSVTSAVIARFQQEAALAARIQSPHLVQVFDVNQESGVFFLVMEYVYGVPAAECAGFLHGTDNTPVPETVALDICIAAARGLAAAHAEGVVHRDLKPENILIPRGADGELEFAKAKLLDLGIAREENSQQDLTGTRMALGTVGFMAPEQARDARTVGKEADVFSMGATLYALLTGRPPFAGDSAFEILTATVSKPHKPVTEIRRDISPMTSDTIDICLKKNAVERFSDAGKLLTALEQCKRHVGTDGQTIRLIRH